MATHFLLASRFALKPGMTKSFLNEIHQDGTRRVFISIDQTEALELRSLNDNISLHQLEDILQSESGTFAPYLTGDVRRELLTFVEAPKDCDSLLPDTPYVQLRHVEVKPDQMGAYRKWREETIFEVVRGHDAAEIFLAYHSVVSGQPGVMFIAGFSTSPDVYTAAFTSERYAEIVRQAGDTYITGGTEGLYTKIYQTSIAQAA